MSTGRFFPGLVVLCLAPLGFASGLPKHVKLEVRLDQMLSSETRAAETGSAPPSIATSLWATKRC